MPSLNFIGGEKGGVGKSVTARVLAQYFIDQALPFTGFDTDRSHTSFARFYADYAAPVVVDTYDGLDHIAQVFDNAGDAAPHVIVDLAAQTAAPLARWMHDSDLVPLMAELGVAVNYWHVADAGQDSVDLLGKLVQTYGEGPQYIVVKNWGRGSDFSPLEQSAAWQTAARWGGRFIDLPALHEASMRKIDRGNLSFWAATQAASGLDSLGMLERQRVKTWLKQVYAQFDPLLAAGPAAG